MIAKEVLALSSLLTYQQIKIQYHWRRFRALLIVGNGELEHDLKLGYGKIPGVHFIGFQNQSVMPSVYQAADIFVLPSIGPGETWGMAVNEAMATGKTILVSDVVGCAFDLVIPGVNGDIFLAGNKQSLKGSMQKMPLTKKSISKNGK